MLKRKAKPTFLNSDAARVLAPIAIRLAWKAVLNAPEIISFARDAYLHFRDPERLAERRRAESERKEAAQRKQARARLLGIIRTRRKYLQRAAHRDADKQVSPYTYQVARHANEALAYRYGIANVSRAKSGRLVPRKQVILRKLERVGPDSFLSKLVEFRDRKVVAVIETGTEYVKTFLPLDSDQWFARYGDFDAALKGNGTFSLKELAEFHIRLVSGERRFGEPQR